MRSIYLTTIFCLSMLSVGAQSDSINIDLSDIIIKENRIELSFNDVSRNIELITKQDIQNLRATSINELLQVVAGVDIRQRGVNGVQADLSIRGGTFEQALVLINGVKMLDPQTGHHLMNLPVSLEDIERIEVLKGPAARIYGQNGFAGAINIVTKVSTEKSITVGIEAGDHGLFNGLAKISAPMGAYAQSVSYAYNSSEGYRDNTDYDIHNLFYQGDLAVGTGSLSVFGGYSSRDFGANGFYGSENFVNQYEEVNTSILSVSLDQKINNFKIIPRLSWRRNYDNWQFLRENPEVFQNFHTTNVFSAEVNSSLTHNLGILGVGVEYNGIDINSNNLGDHTRGQIGFHVENRFLLADERIDITPGVYLLDISDIGTKVFPGLDMGYRITNQWKAFVSVGYTSRIPSFTDLYYEDSGNIGNPNLQEESAFTSEIGVKYNNANTILTASLFSRRATDQIDWFRASPDDKWMPDNFSSATYNGLDLSTTFRWSDSFVRSVRVNYLYLDAEFEDNDFAFSRNVLENLQHQLIVNPIFNLSDHFSFHFLLKYNDRVSLEDYTLVDANVSYQKEGMELYLKASNLFDTEYKETNLVPMPGRWVVLGAKYRM